MKIQLMVFVNDREEEWLNWLRNTNFDDVEVVDIISNRYGIGFAYKFREFLGYNKFNTHLFDGSTEEAINFFVRRQCDYYIVVTDVVNELAFDIQYLKNNCDQHIIFMEGSDGYLNDLVVSVAEHIRVGGFGVQPLIEKISYDCANHDGREEIYESPTS